MRAKSNELVNELVSACIAFGRQVEPDWQTRIDKAQRELREAVTHDVRKWSYVAKVLTTWKGNGRKGVKAVKPEKLQAGSYEAWKARGL